MLAAFPSLGAKLLCIWTEYVFTAGSDVLRIDDELAPADENRRGSIWAAAVG